MNGIHKAEEDNMKLFEDIFNDLQRPGMGHEQRQSIMLMKNILDKEKEDDKNKPIIISKLKPKCN